MVDVTKIISNHTIDNTMDLIYTIYIGRYTQEILGVTPDFSALDCTEIQGRLATSEYNGFYLYAYQQGWVNDSLSFVKDLNIEEEVPQRALRFIHLDSVTPYGLMPSYDLQDLDEKREVRISQLQTYYTNLIAYLVVLKYMRENVIKTIEPWVRPVIHLDTRLFSMRFNFTTLLHITQYQDVQETVDLPIEMYLGDNIHNYHYDNWVFDNMEKDNFKTKGYTYAEKHEHIKDSKYYQVGLPIFKYEKAVNLTAGKISGLKQVHLCIIKAIDNMSLTLNTTSVNGTHEDLDYMKERYNHLDEIFMVDNGISATNQRLEVLDYSFIGIDSKMMGTMRLWGTKEEDRQDNFLDEMFEEKYFIRGIGERLTTDLHITCPEFPSVYTQGHKYFNAQMTYADAIYWLLNDHKIDFDKELYKKVYCSYFEHDKPYAEMETKELIKALTNSKLGSNNQLAIDMQEHYDAYNYTI